MDPRLREDDVLIGTTPLYLPSVRGVIGKRTTNLGVSASASA